MSTAPDDDLTVIRCDRFFSHPPAAVRRTPIGPGRSPRGRRRAHRCFRSSGPPLLLDYDIERMPIVRWEDADPDSPVGRSVTWTVEQEGRRTRLFLVREGFDPDDPGQPRARKITDGGRRSHVLRAWGETLERLR